MSLVLAARDMKYPVKMAYTEAIFTFFETIISYLDMSLIYKYVIDSKNI